MTPLLPLDAFPEAVLLADEERRYVDANSAACSLLRREREEIVGLRVDDLVVAPAEAVARIWREFIVSGSMRGEVVLRDREGEPLGLDFHALARVQPGMHLAVLRPKDALGKVPLDLLSELVALQREALAPDARLEAVMQSICTRATEMTRAEGAVLEMQEGDEMVYRVATGTMSPFLGFRLPRAGSLSGMSLGLREVLVCNDSETDPRVNRDACRKVGARSMVLVPLEHDGDVVGVLKVASGRVAGFDETTVEILRLTAGFLGAAMATADANETRRALVEGEATRLAELERLRAEMTSMLVHDLRSPLAVISLNLDFLRDELSEAGADTVSAAVDAIRATRRLNELISGLLEIAKLEQRRLVPEPTGIDLHAMVEEMLTARGAAARDRALTLTNSVPEGLVLTADQGLIRRVFDNILDNAVRHVPDAGRIDIGAVRHEGRTVVRIGNTGIAVPAEARSKVFEKFTQLDQSDRRNFGIGLYFSKLAVEAHHGRIWIESSDELPAIFVIELPDRGVAASARVGGASDRSDRPRA